MTTQRVIPESVWQQNPLFWSKQGDLVVPKKRPNIFIGVGIATTHRLSQAIPFDEIGFLLSAEFIKRKIPDSHVFVFIADQHAWLANNLSISQAKKMARKQRDFLAQFITLLKLKNWKVILASHLFPQALPVNYEKLERRDVSFFINHHQVGIKIGWKFSCQNIVHKTDEAHFDVLLSDKNLVSMFTRPGLTLDSQKLHESPYVASNPLARLIVSPKEEVGEKLTTASCSLGQIQAVRNQLRKTMALFGKLVRPLPPKTPIDEKVQTIINDFAADI